MGKLVVFDFISLNGFFKGPDGDLSWAHGDEESDAFAIEANKEGGMLLFGRVTYEMMAGFWPTPYAHELNAAMAEEGLIDEFRIMIHPIVLSGGTPILNGIKRKLNLKPVSSRVFKSGKVLLCYEPVE